jgi:hypothetical protein
MKALLLEMSGGLMDSGYFRLIEQGKITNAMEAQAYFAKRKAELLRISTSKTSMGQKPRGGKSLTPPFK